MIKLDNVTFQYHTNEEPRLKNISLEIEKGEFVSVLGHNGSGKSTFVKHLNGLLIPSSGAVNVDGLSTMDYHQVIEIRQKLSMVFQNPDNQIVATVVENDAAFALENLGLPREEIQLRVEETLKKLDLWEYRGRAPHNLSGGQKQKLAIASVLVMKPEYLVLDEPTAMLDPQTRREIMNMVLSLHQEGLTIIYVTHFMNEAIKAPRTIVFQDGQIAFDGKTSELFQNVKKLEKFNLEPTEMSLLDLNASKRGFWPYQGILSVEEMMEFVCQ